MARRNKNSTYIVIISGFKGCKAKIHQHKHREGSPKTLLPYFFPGTSTCHVAQAGWPQTQYSPASTSPMQSYRPALTGSSSTSMFLSRTATKPLMCFVLFCYVFNLHHYILTNPSICSFCKTDWVLSNWEEEISPLKSRPPVSEDKWKGREAWKEERKYLLTYNK